MEGGAHPEEHSISTERRESHLHWSRPAQAANSLALGTSPVVRALFDPEGSMRDVRALDRVSFTDWFKSHGGSQGSIDKMWCAPARNVLSPARQLPCARMYRCGFSFILQ